MVIANITIYDKFSAIVYSDTLLLDTSLYLEYSNVQCRFDCMNYAVLGSAVSFFHNAHHHAFMRSL